MDTAKWGVETSDKMSVYMKDMLAGDGTNRWFDKTMNYAICANGRGGATGEHSPADGAEMDHVCENFLNLDKQILKSPSKEEQLEIAKLDEPSNYLKLAEKLEFEVEEGLEEEVERCYEAHTKAVADLHVHSIIFLDFGKGRLKKCGISPDGFVQMAIQLAYFEVGRSAFLLQGSLPGVCGKFQILPSSENSVNLFFKYFPSSAKLANLANLPPTPSAFQAA